MDSLNVEQEKAPIGWEDTLASLEGEDYVETQSLKGKKGTLLLRC